MGKLMDTLFNTIASIVVIMFLGVVIYVIWNILTGDHEQDEY